MLALRNCYHGMSEGTMGVTAHSTWKFPVPQARTFCPCALSSGLYGGVSVLAAAAHRHFYEMLALLTGAGFTCMQACKCSAANIAHAGMPNMVSRCLSAWGLEQCRSRQATSTGAMSWMLTPAFVLRAQGFGIRHVLNPNPYTGAFGNDGAKYAEDVADVIATATPGEGHFGTAVAVKCRCSENVARC